MLSMWYLTLVWINNMLIPISVRHLETLVCNCLLWQPRRCAIHPSCRRELLQCGQLTAFSAASLGSPSAFPERPCSSGPGHLWSSQDAFGSSLRTALCVGLADLPRQPVYRPSFPGELSLTAWKRFCLVLLPLPMISHRHNSKTSHPSNVVFKFDSWGTKSTQYIIYFPLPCKLVMNSSWGTFSIACFFVIHELYIFLRKCFLLKQLCIVPNIFAYCYWVGPWYVLRKALMVLSSLLSSRGFLLILYHEVYV